MDSAVIVVGAGPVGLMLAGELRLAGVPVVVLERLTGPTGQSRGARVHRAHHGGVRPARACCRGSAR